MANGNQAKKTVRLFDRDELILGRLDDIKESQRELKNEMRELKNEMNRLNDRMSNLENEVRNSSRHSQMMAASVVGIALAVIYFVFTH